MVKKGAHITKDLGQLGILLVALVLLNYVGSFFFARIDLTTEKRYTLAEPTLKLLDNLNDVVFVRVYLDGELPAGFRRLRDRTRETLDEFRARSGQQIEYEFIDPSNQPDEKSRKELYDQLVKKGVMPTNIQIKKGDGVEQKLIFPGAIVSFNEKEVPLQLLKSQMGASPEQMLNASLEEIEYELTNAIRKAGMVRSQSLAIIDGHGELSPRQIADFTMSLSEYYSVERVKINGQLGTLTERTQTDSGVIVLPKYKMVVVAKPDSTFAERDKFVLDQYAMYGGRILWLVEPVLCNMDSLQYAPSTLAIPLSVNLEDQLFRYGVRVNTDVIQDLRCASIPGPAGYVGDQLQWALQPWVFFPVVIPDSDHPIVRNLNGIKLEFAASLDTVTSAGVKKTVLLHTSQRSRVLTTPARVSLDVMVKEPNERQMNRANMPVAVLLEGSFTSLYKNRLLPELAQAKEVAFREKSRYTKMIVVSDGDVARNTFSPDGMPLPAGFDKYSGQQYGNNKFILNAVNYLMDDEALTTVRSRNLEIRLLDRKRAEAESTGWQAINTALPIALVLLFGAIWAFIRKKRFAQ